MEKDLASQIEELKARLGASEKAYPMHHKENEDWKVVSFREKWVEIFKAGSAELSSSFTASFI